MINEELLNLLVKSILTNDDFNYEKDGLNILSKSFDNGLSLQISYEKSEVEDFEKYLDSIDDDIFEGVCEFMGGDEISVISNLLLNNPEEGIAKFKSYLKEYLNSKINYYTECLNTYLK